MDREFFALHAGAIYLSQIVCFITVIQVSKFLERKEKLGFWMSVGGFFVGLHAGYGLVRIYFHIWPTYPEWSVHWLSKELLAFLAAGYVIFLVLYTASILIGVKKHPVT